MGRVWFRSRGIADSQVAVAVVDALIFDRAASFRAIEASTLMNVINVEVPMR